MKENNKGTRRNTQETVLVSELVPVEEADVPAWLFRSLPVSIA